MTSTRKVKLQDRGTPEPKPARKVVLDELLRSLQDLVTHELAVDVSLDDSPAPIAAASPPPARPEPSAPKAAAAAPEPEPEPEDLTIEELVAEPVASPADVVITAATDSRPAVAPASKAKPLELAADAAPIAPASERKAAAPAAIAKAQPEKPSARSKPLELAVGSGPVASTPERKPATSAALAEPKTAKPAPNSRSLELATEPTSTAPAAERKAAATASDPATAPRSRRGKLGDTVVLTPRDIPAPPKAAHKRGGRPSVVETPVPPEGLQQQLPYLDLSPSAAGGAPDTGLVVEPEIEIPHLPDADKPARGAPASRSTPRVDRDLLTEPAIEIPDLPGAGLMTAGPAIPAPTDRASTLATDGPDELPDLDHSAAPPAAPARPTALSVVDDDTGPSDIPLLEDAIDLDEHIELSTPKAPTAPAKRTAPPPAGNDPRRLAIQLAARLNVDLRREGKPVLGSDVIAKLAKLLEESLAKGAPNMENTRPKKP